MRQRPSWSASLILCSFLAACAGSEAATLASVSIDTLPGGVISVMSPGPTAWMDSATGWRLVEDGELEGGLGTPGEFINPQDLAVDARGWVYVADTRPATIKVFDERGRFVRKFGRDGGGPGEFGVAFLAVQGARLLVHDPGASRASLFDTSGTYIRSFVGTCCYWMRPYLDERMRVILPSPDAAEAKTWRTFIVFDTLGIATDTILVPEKPAGESWEVRQGNRLQMSTTVPYSSEGAATFTPTGTLLHAWSGEYRIAMSAGGDDTTRVFGRAWTPEPLAGAKRDTAYDQQIARLAKSLELREADLRTQFDKSKIPSTLPAFEGISVDALGNLWVHVLQDWRRTRFDVFDREGAYLGPVEVGAEISTYRSAWGRDAMYLITESDEGYPRIARYRIVRR